MADLLFVVPAFSPKLEEESIGTLILAKIAIAAGFDVRILRYWEVCEKFDDYCSFKKKLVERILSLNPKIVSFYSRCTDYHICVDVSDTLVSMNCSSKIVLGGPQAELVAIETLETFSSIDYICCSEGETTIVPFLKFLLCNEDNAISADSIHGLVYRDGSGKVCKNALPQLLPNDYASCVNYYDIIPFEVIEKSHRTTLDVGRGCPFSCSFCSTKTFWKRNFRLRNIRDIVDEIEYVVKNIGITRFDLDHDIFTLNRNKVIEFCNELKKRNLSISWYCSSRIDTIDKGLIDIMVESGLVKIMFGIESASPRMQKIIHKNLNLDDCVEIVRYCHSKGLRVITSFIYGLPEDTEEDFEKTFRMMQDFQYMGSNVSTYLCGVLNGTELFEKYHDKLVFSIKNVKNHKYFGLCELNDMVMRNPSIFPHFYDIEVPLRMRLRYFEVFRNIWNKFFPQTFGYISKLFLNAALRYLDMYYMFVGVNDISVMRSEVNDDFFGMTEKQCFEFAGNFIQGIKELIGTGHMTSAEYDVILERFEGESSKNNDRNHG